MARPLSNSALRALGKRLVAHEQPDDADLRELQAVLAAYEPVRDDVVSKVTEVTGIAPASRIKNTGTILEKLRRGHSLDSIRDLAGLRLVVPRRGGRDEQDGLVARLTSIFEDVSRSPKVVDRRVQLIQGYRAVHVIVYPEAFPIEIQVRTWAQHRWAEGFERLADEVGRGIRYGEPSSAYSMVDQQRIRWMLRLADGIAEHEQAGMPPVGLLVFGVLDALESMRNE